jgi:hypothetical protein
MVPLVDLARQHGLAPDLLAQRLKIGWDIEKAVSTPVRKQRMKAYQPRPAVDDEMTRVGRCKSPEREEAERLLRDGISRAALLQRGISQNIIAFAIRTVFA